MRQPPSKARSNSSHCREREELREDLGKALRGREGLLRLPGAPAVPSRFFQREGLPTELLCPLEGEQVLRIQSLV